MTLGLAESEQHVVVHTFEQTDPSTALVRIISARRATRREIADYEREQQ